MVAFPTLAVEVAFAANPNDTSPVWTDISAYVQGFQTHRGRSTELDQFQPGTCTVRLDNQDRRFDPTYAASPYAPNVLIGKRMRISAGANLVPNPSFEANTTGWSTTGTTTLTRTAVSDAAAGSYVGRAVYSATAGDWVGSLGTVTVTASTTYTSSVWLRGTAGRQVHVRWWDNISGEASAGGDSITLTGNWQRVSITRATAVGATTAGVLIRSPHVSFTVDIDAWQFERGESATVYTDGTYRLFDGYIDAWPQTWTSQVAASTPLRATDAFKRFQQFPLNGTYSSVISGNAPWAYFPFNGVITDSSGSGNNGTWTGSNPSSYSSFAPLQLTANGSKYFGINDLMTFGTTNWSIGSGFTIEVWLAPSGWTGADGADHGIYQTMVTHSDVANAIVFMKTISNYLFFRVVSPSGTLQDLLYAVNATSMAANVWHHYAITASPSAGLMLYRDGVLVTGPSYVGTLSLPTTAPAAPRWGIGYNAYANSTFLAHAAIYSQPLTADQIYDRYRSTLCNFPAESSAARIGRTLDIMAWPSSRRDLDGGAAALAIGAANEQMLAYLQKVNNSEVGRLFMGGTGDVRFIGRDAAVAPPYTTSMAVFGDDPVSGELPYSDIVLSYDDARTWNEIRLQRLGGQLQIARDTTLQTTDIVRTYADTALLHSTDADTLAAAQYRLNAYKSPTVRIESMTIQPPKAPATLWPHALGRDIGDRVTVVRRPQRISPSISQQCVIEGVGHAFDASGTWQTTYDLSRADDTTYWLLGTAGFSELDTTTRLSF